MPFSIIIPSRTASNLIPCIRAIREAGETARIIVVDDGVDWGSGCDDGKTAALPTWAWPFDVVPGEKPFIFARNVNIGIRAAGDDDVIVLNDDALLKTPEGFDADLYRHWMQWLHDRGRCERTKDWDWRKSMADYALVQGGRLSDAGGKA